MTREELEGLTSNLLTEESLQILAEFDRLTYERDWWQGLAKVCEAEIGLLKPKAEALERIIPLLIEEGYLKGTEPIEAIKPGHGNCCTCQDCGQHHDDCVCGHNHLLARLREAGICDYRDSQQKPLDAAAHQIDTEVMEQYKKRVEVDLRRSEKPCPSCEGLSNGFSSVPLLKCTCAKCGREIEPEKPKEEERLREILERHIAGQQAYKAECGFFYFLRSSITTAITDILKEFKLR